MPYSPSPGAVQTTAAAPSGAANTTGLMAGLGIQTNPWALTPKVTGRVLIMISGSMGTAATAETCGVTLYYGTGTAPSNGAAITGTAIGTILTFVTLTNMLRSPFAAHAIIEGLAVPSINSVGATTAATPVWFDVAQKASAGTVTLTLLNLTAIEF